MVKLKITQDSFRLFKTFPVIPRLVLVFVLAVGGIMIQLFLPINGIFPFEKTQLSIIPFFVGLVLIVGAFILVLPEKVSVSEIPKLVEGKGTWEETTMKSLSSYFNLINKRKSKGKKAAAFFDLSTGKGKGLFIGTIFGLTVIYLISLLLGNRLHTASVAFLVDIYLFVIPLWFIIRVESWDPDILRKILFYYQFTKLADLDEYEFTAVPAVQLKQVDDSNVDEEIFLPTNVRFDVKFEDAPSTFHSLAIQVLINEKLGNKYPSFVCFLRMNKPSDWKPLKKDEATADRIVRIKHLVEDDDLHLFVLSKTTKVDNSEHTSPRDAAKIFKRAHKMMLDFA